MDKDLSLNNQYMSHKSNAWAEYIVLGKTPYIAYQQHASRYVFASKIVGNKIVLDIACGTGYGSMYLVQKKAKEILGVDVNKEAIVYANSQYKTDKLSFIRGEASNLPLRDTIVGVVVSFETIEHLRHCKKFLLEIQRILRKDGTFICSTPNKEVFSPNVKKPLDPYHVREFYLEEFFALLKKHFSNVKLYCQCYLYPHHRIKTKMLSLGGKAFDLFPKE